MTEIDNSAVAGKLRQMADTLELQEADGFRVRAYRKAAETIEGLATPVAILVDRGGIEALDALPGIGRGIASAIAELTTTGRWMQLERLLGALEPETLFRSLPGIGPDLARKIHETLGVETLEELENAVRSGKLDEVPGIGKRRVEAIRLALSERLGRRRLRSHATGTAPSVADLLDVDREYRARAEAGELRKIAPKRLNPTGEAWLPVLHTERGPWEFTALFSNTAKAHDLGKTRDWVVIYFHSGHEAEHQCTVVTETHGALAGRRVVRGREGECAGTYAGRDA